MVSKASPGVLNSSRENLRKGVEGQMSEHAVNSLPLQRTAEVPFAAYKRQQAALARRRLYPLTAFYTFYAMMVLAIAFTTKHPWIAVAFFFVGCATWTLVEYLFHRYVLHGRFAPGKGLIRKFLHERLDPLHWDHHARPFDGSHISGGLKDILPLFFVAAPISFLFPVYTAPVVLAGAVQNYACEEWLHYALHFSNSRFPLFRRMKKYHLYHHSPRGIDKGYGITTRFWDGVFGTRFPRSVRRSLSKD
jgi:4-hydroxysphinganine ceramide fatty acyl 2-hydroxylase